MAYKCKSCNKISKGKKQRSITSFFKKHRCQGCGSFDFIDLGEVIGLIYDFEELIFDFVEETDCGYEEEGGILYPEEEDTFADEDFQGVLVARDDRVDEEDMVPYRDSVFPTTFTTDDIVADDSPTEDSYDSGSSCDSCGSDD